MFCRYVLRCRNASAWMCPRTFPSSIRYILATFSAALLYGNDDDDDDRSSSSSSSSSVYWIVYKRLVTPLIGNGFSAIPSLFFVVDRKDSIFGISEFFYVCPYANFLFLRWSCDHFSAPFMDLYLPNAWSQTLLASISHTFRASAFHRYHWFGAKLFPVVVCRIVEGYSKNAKKCVLDLAPPMLQNSGICHDSTRPSLHFDGLPPKSWRSVVSVYFLGCVTSITAKNIVVLVWPGAAHPPIAV